MAMTLLERLLRLIDDKTRSIGTPVANLFGAARASTASSTTPTTQAWLVLELGGQAPTTVEAFYAAFVNAPTPENTRTTTTTGQVAATASDTRTFLVKGSVTLEHPRTIRLTAATGSAQSPLAIYVDETLIRSGSNVVSVPVALPAGTHVLEVLATGKGVAVQVPDDLPVTSALDTLALPQWAAVTTGWLDATNAVAANFLSWHVDPRAGGWRVLRRQLSDLTTITEVNTAVNGVFTAVLTGDQTTELTVGETLYAGADSMGTVQALQFDADTTTTVVTVRLPEGTATVSDAWVGLLAATGAFQEVHRSSRTATAGLQTWNDADVVLGATYEYALQSYGFFDPSTFSAVSDVQEVCTGDTGAPGSITLTDSYPKIVSGQALVKFTAPTDADYAGVKVVSRTQYTGTVASATSTVLTLPASTFPSTSLAGYTIRITAGTGAGQVRVCSASTTTTVSVAAADAWLVTPDATSDVLVFRDRVLTTNYGAPGVAHFFAFEPDDLDASAPEQLYLLPTFDFAGNTQNDTDCESWLFNPADQGVSTVSATVLITLVSATSSAVTLQVDATSPDGTPQVRWNFESGSTSCTACTATGGDTLGTLVASGTQWTFTRPDSLTAPAQVGFEAVLAGVVTDADTFTIAEQGIDTSNVLSGLQVTVIQTASDATSVTVSVTATDPAPDGSSTPLTLHLFDTNGLAAGGITPSTDVTGTGTITQSYVLARPAAGGGVARVVWQVTSSNTNKIADFDSVDVEPQAKGDAYCQCYAKVTATTATTVTVTVTANTNTGTPQVELVGLTGSATLASGTAAGTFVAQNGTSNVWVFTRGAINTGTGQAQFRAHLSGFEDDDAFLAIEEQGRDTVALGVKAKVVTTAADHVVVRVYAIDPFPQGTNSIAIAWESVGTGAVTPPTPLTLTPTSDFATTGHIDFTVFLPAFALGPGHFLVTASAAGRVSAVDSVVIPGVVQDTQSCQCTAKVTATSTTTVTVTVTATAPSGTPQVEFVGLTGGASLASGTAAGTLVTPNGANNVWVFTRGGVGAGVGQAQFRAHVAGTTAIPVVDDDDFVDIPDQGQDTRALAMSLESVGTTATTETVRVKVIDPNPQGANTVTVQYFALGTGAITPASGQTLTPTADLTTTGFVDFVITRAPVGNDQGTVKFLATCANRVEDADSCYITAQRQTSFGPSMNVSYVGGATTGTFTYTATGTLTYKKNNGTAVAPPVSPFSVNRPAVGAADDTYTFLCVKDSQTTQDSFTVTAIGATDTVTPDLQVVPQSVSATSLGFTITATAPSGGGTPTITVTPTNTTAHYNSVAHSTAFTITSGGVVAFDRPAFNSTPALATIRAALAGGGAETVTQPILNQERDTQYSECKARIVATTATTVTVQVDATSPTGTPQVALIATTGTATVNTRPAGAGTDGTFVASGSQWIFNRGAVPTTGTGAGTGQAQFRAHLAGLQDDDDLVGIPDQGVDTRALDVTAHISAQTPTTTTVTVTVADPIPQGANSITLTVPVIDNVPAITQNGTAVTTGSSFLMSPGASLDFVITRPDFGAGLGGVKWQAAAANRVTDYDTVQITEKLRDTMPSKLELTALTYDGPNARYQVHFKFFTSNADGTQFEWTAIDTWTNHLSSVCLVTDVETGATAVASTPGSYDPTLGWKVEWASGTNQAWSFHQTVGQGGQSWNGTQLTPSPDATLSIIVPKFATSTVSDAVETSLTYPDPDFIPSLSGTKVTGDISGNAANITAFTINQNVGTGDTPTFNGLTLSGALHWSTDNAQDIGASAANRPRDFYLGRNATISGTLAVSGVTTFSQTIKFGTDNSFDIGLAAANRPRDLFLARNASVGGTLSVSGTATFSSTATFNGAVNASGGALTAGTSTAAQEVRLNGPSSVQSRIVRWMTAGVSRWAMYANNTAESGSDAGSNFDLSAYDDTGAIIDSPIGITRAANGQMTLNRPTLFTGYAGIGGLSSNIGFLLAAVSSVANTTKYGFYSEPSFDSSVTAAGTAYYGVVRTTAAAFTMGVARGLYIGNAQVGSGSSITNQYGVFMDALTSGTNNFAIYTQGGVHRLGDTVRISGGSSASGGDMALWWDAAAGANVQAFSSKPLNLNPLGNAITMGGALTGTSVTWSAAGQVVNFTGSSPYINFNASGGGAPTTTTRSSGTKLVLFNTLGATVVDYAIGIESNGLWMSVPNTGEHFAWYGGTTPAATLTGTGTLTLSGDLSADTATLLDAQVLRHPTFGPNGTNPENGNWDTLYTALAAGEPLFFDEEFANGNNSVVRYNNGTASITVTRTADAGAPNKTGQTLVISWDGVTGTTTPGLGGFLLNFNGRRNATFVQRFRAKIPVGYTVNLAENTQGTNAMSYWLTSQAGTGKWEEYIRVDHCGNTGTFSGSGHVYLTGPAGAWSIALASINVYEVQRNAILNVLGAANALNSAITASSLTSLGTLNSLTVSGAATFQTTAHIQGAATLDSTLQVAGTTTLNGYVTVNAGLQVGTNTVAHNLSLYGPAGQIRDIIWTTAGSNRWILRADNTAETGSDTGTAFALIARHDDGSIIDNVFTATRAGGGTFAVFRPTTLSQTLDVGTVTSVPAAQLRLGGDFRSTGVGYADDFVLTDGTGGTGGSGGGAIAVQFNGGSITSTLGTLNFTGGGVSVTGDGGGLATVTITGAVSSVFGRTGAIVATAGDYTFAQISSKPTSLGGYGITDGVTTTGAGASGTWNISVSGNAATATTATTAASAGQLTIARTINGVSFNGTANVTVPAAAVTLTGTTLASGVTASSLTSFGTVSALTMAGTNPLDLSTAPLLGALANGNARTAYNVCSYAVDGVDIAGALVIKTSIPTTISHMVRIHLVGYQYDADAPIDMVIGLYMYSGGSYPNKGYMSIGKYRWQVRAAFSPDGFHTIILDDVAVTHDYLKLTVADVTIGFSTYNVAHFQGWTISNVTSLTGYTNIVTVPDVTTLLTSQLSGTSLPSTITGSSLTSVGALTSLSVVGNISTNANLTLQTSGEIVFGGVTRMTGTTAYTSLAGPAGDTRLWLGTATGDNAAYINGSSVLLRDTSSVTYFTANAAGATTVGQMQAVNFSAVGNTNPYYKLNDGTRTSFLQIASGVLQLVHNGVTGLAIDTSGNSTMNTLLVNGTLKVTGSGGFTIGAATNVARMTYGNNFASTYELFTEGNAYATFMASNITAKSNGQFNVDSSSGSVGYLIGGISRMTGDTSFTYLRDGSGRIGVYLGNTDPTNYYDNTAHQIRSRTSSIYAIIDSSGFSLSSGLSFMINGQIRLNDASGVYTQLWSPGQTASILLGNGSDPGNYYSNTSHTFRSAAGSIYATLSASSLTVNSTVAATAFVISGGGEFVWTGTYTEITDNVGQAYILIGGAGDAQNYYDNGQHRFRDRAHGTQFALINGSGVTATDFILS